MKLAGRRLLTTYLLLENWNCRQPCGSRLWLKCGLLKELSHDFSTHKRAENRKKNDKRTIALLYVNINFILARNNRYHYESLENRPKPPRRFTDHTKTSDEVIAGGALTIMYSL